MDSSPAPPPPTATDFQGSTIAIANNYPDFSDNLARVAAFVAEHGHATIPIRYISDDGVKLGVWVMHQRAAHSAGTLAAGRVEALRALGFEFVVGTTRPRIPALAAAS